MERRSPRPIDPEPGVAQLPDGAWYDHDGFTVFSDTRSFLCVGKNHAVNPLPRAGARPQSRPPDLVPQQKRHLLAHRAHRARCLRAAPHWCIVVSYMHLDPLRRLRVFLCHSSNDKAAVRDLYRRLRNDGVDPWLDQEDLLPGQDWNHEIGRASCRERV